MALDFRTIALAALVETGGRVIMNPATDAVVLSRPAVAALAQGDEWLPAWRDADLREELLADGRRTCPSIVDLSVEYAGDGLTRVTVIVDRESAQGGGRARSVREELCDALAAMGHSARLIASADRVEMVPVLS